MREFQLILSLTLVSFGAFANSNTAKTVNRPEDILSILAQMKYDYSAGKLSGGRFDLMSEKALAGYRVKKIEISKDPNFCNALVTYENSIDHTIVQESSNVIIGGQSLLELNCSSF